MGKKHIIIIALLLTFFVGYRFYSKIQKDNWVKESPEIKHAEARENEVWGEILRGNDAGLYYGTPLYDLAKEMTCFYWFRSDKKIEELINEIPKEYINFQDDKYGMTIGQFALFNSNLKAVLLLLDRGLNPNLIGNKVANGRALIIDINGPFISRLPEGLETLKYMIKKGADVNLYSENAYTTPLIEAAKYNFENVKVLVNSGANPHFRKELFSEDHSYSNYISPLESALMYKRIDIVNYLIFEQKVDFRTLKYPKWSKFHPGEYQILHDLRDMPFELNTKEHQEKMKLVAYLKTQGLDYWKTPIRDYIKTNPHYNNKEYLSKY